MTARSTAELAAMLRELVKLGMPVRMTSASLAEIVDHLTTHACADVECPATTYRCAER